MSLRPADSWYEATAQRDARPAAARGRHRGGRLRRRRRPLRLLDRACTSRERGYKVVLLEAERIGFGASGRSGGQIIPGWACGMDKTRRAARTRSTQSGVWDFGVEAVELTRSADRANQIDCDLPGATCTSASSRASAQELRDMAARAGKRLRLPQAPLHGDGRGRRMDREQALHRRALRRRRGPPASACATRSASARRPWRRACGCTKAAGSPTFSTGRRSRCTRRKAACARNSSRFAPTSGTRTSRTRLARKLIGVASYIVATKPLGAERAAALLKDNVAVADINWVIDYYRRLSGSPPAVRRARQLLRPRPARHRARYAASHAERFPAACRCRDRLRLGRDDRHHDEPRAEFRPARAERLLPPGLFRPRHGRNPDRGQDRRRGDRRARPSVSTSSRASSTTSSRAAGSSAARRSCMAMTWFRLRDLMP